MIITINKTEAEVLDGETLLETSLRTGHNVPSLCYAQGAVHQSSCMVCAVRDANSGQIIPSCTTHPTEGMVIETDSEEVQMIRTLALELLLSDHRADCEAPCSLVCPKGLDIERMFHLYDTKLYKEAHRLIAGVFDLPASGCDDCKAPCEKVCRRGTIDQAVSIRTIIGKIAGMYEPLAINTKKDIRKTDKSVFQSRPGRFTENEKERIIKSESSDPDGELKPSRCLHCACAGRKGCKLRLYATEAGIRRPRYELSSALPVMKKIHVNGKMWFEPAKCIRCGLCVYNSNNGFTFRDRGFGMQVIIPEENLTNVSEGLAKLCPTGALYVSERNQN